MKIKIAALGNAALDWAAAQCVGLPVERSRGDLLVFDAHAHEDWADPNDDYHNHVFAPTRKPAQAERILADRAIGFLPPNGHRGSQWQAFLWHPTQHDLSIEDGMSYRQFGPTRIVAGLRCLLAVVSEADEVDVPDWLAKKT